MVQGHRQIGNLPWPRWIPKYTGLVRKRLVFTCARRRILPPGVETSQLVLYLGSLAMNKRKHHHGVLTISSVNPLDVPPWGGAAALLSRLGLANSHLPHPAALYAEWEAREGGCFWHWCGACGSAGKAVTHKLTQIAARERERVMCIAWCLYRIYTCIPMNLRTIENFTGWGIM